VLLVSQEDWRVVEFGLGLTDLAKEVAAGSDAMIAGEDYDVAGFRKKMEEYRPAWVAFHGKEAAKVFLRAQGSPKAVRNGRQRWKVASSEVFVLPSASAANQKPDYDGTEDRLKWWQEFALMSGTEPIPTAKSAQRSDAPGQLTLHEAMVLVLRERGTEWMERDELAAEIAKRISTGERTATRLQAIS
jgi:hypothetical protein